jgi:hypothetical protein
MLSVRRGLRKFPAAAIACSALFFAAACDKKQDSAPTPSAGMPPLDQPATGAVPGDHPVHPPTAGGDNALPPGHPALPEGHPATLGGPPQQQPMATPPSGAFVGTTPGGAFDPKTVLAGTIKADGKVKDKIAAGDVIFVVARRYEEGATGPGTPLAVQKLTFDKFPLKFSLDSRDAMLAGTTLSGKVVVTVRVDKDGDAITKNPGDVTGQSKPVEPPKKDVVVSLDTIL